MNANDELKALQEKHKAEEQALKEKAATEERRLREKAAVALAKKNMEVKMKLAQALLDADTEDLLFLVPVDSGHKDAYQRNRVVLHWYLPGKSYPESIEVKFHDTSDTWSRSRSGEYKYRFEFDYKGKWIKKPATVIKNIKDAIEQAEIKTRIEDEKTKALDLGEQYFSKFLGVISVERQPGYDSRGGTYNQHGSYRPDRIKVETVKGFITYSVDLLKGELRHKFYGMALKDEVRDELLNDMLNGK